MEVLATATAVQSVPAQVQHCALICVPAFTFTPAIIRSHIFGSARVRSLTTGAVSNIASTNNVELIFGVGAATFIPRLSVIASFQ